MRRFIDDTRDIRRDIDDLRTIKQPEDASFYSQQRPSPMRLSNIKPAVNRYATMNDTVMSNQDISGGG